MKKIIFLLLLSISQISFAATYVATGTWDIFGNANIEAVTQDGNVLEDWSNTPATWDNSSFNTLQYKLEFTKPFTFTDNDHVQIWETELADIHHGLTGILLASQTTEDCIIYDRSFYIKVHDSQVSNVPVPAAVWLFSSGLVGLISFKRR